MYCAKCRKNIASNMSWGICPSCGGALSSSAKTKKVSNHALRYIIGGVSVGIVLLLLAGVAISRAMLNRPIAYDRTEVPIVVPTPIPAELETEKQLDPGLPAEEKKHAVVESAPVMPPAQTLSNVARLMQEQQVLQRDDIEKRVSEGLKEVEKHKSGHVIVGQLKMAGSASPRDVISQMEILEDGYFVEAVAAAGMPIHFWHPGYDRHSVFPRKQSGIENIGEVILKPTNASLGTLRGIALANGSEIPKDLKVQVNYSIPALNRCGTDDRKQAAIEGEVLKRLKSLTPPTIEIVPETGEFKISNLLDTRFGLSLTASPNDWWTREFDISPGEQIDLGLCTMYRRDAAQTQAVTLKDEPWARDGKPLVTKMLKRLSDATVYKYFQNNLDGEIKLVEEWRKKHGERSAVVLVGQIEVPGQEFDGEQVVAQMPLSKGGFFCEAVRTGAPIGFRLHGYEPLDHIPQGSHDGVEYCGVLKMRKTRQTDFAAMQGNILVEGGRAPADLRVYASVETDNINHYNNSGGTGGHPRDTPTPQANITGNRFLFRQLSPIEYSLGVTGSGLVSQFRSIRFEHNERRTLPPFTVFRQRQVTLSHMTSKTGDFSAVQIAKSIVDTNRGRWRSLPDPAVYQNYAVDLFIEQTGNSVEASGSYAPCSIFDLGVRNLEACREIDVTSFVNSNRGGIGNYGLRSSHVYLLKQWHWKHWILFKVDSIDLAPKKLK